MTEPVEIQSPTEAPTKFFGNEELFKSRKVPPTMKKAAPVIVGALVATAGIALLWRSRARSRTRS